MRLDVVHERARRHAAPAPRVPVRWEASGAALGNRRIAAMAAARSGVALQRTRDEAEALEQHGRAWRALKFAPADVATRSQFRRLLDVLNPTLAVFGFSVSSGWQPYDPIVRRGGRPSSYTALVARIAGAGDSRQAAETFIAWQEGDVRFVDLPGDLQDLALITHWAEIGRGYDVGASLHNWMVDIATAESAAAAQRLWLDVKRYFPPSQTAREETDYDPSEPEL